MENKEILRKRVDELAARVGGEVEEGIGTLVLKIQATYIAEVLTAAKSFEGVPCDFLHDLGGVDGGDHFEVVYHLTSWNGPQKLRVKAILDHENPVIDSVTRIWAGANFMEREAYDMFGIQFKGHPNLKRIYMWDDFEGFPLRKDYVIESEEVRDITRVRTENE
ncbi:NADH-quinone oxidoreductase subunit C [Desulfitobacterium metallireducens]|uniref:NADH-quinone oxidoreductase subunit C n=1 Tax=Desulfitobacterium metallireducens DSM 15288 TaxID=871968 RepID=W0E9X5_9FIRM|nr:NADH-quinone oxidoreductase subunit C [Desulfitobacterium metallireducens]AHF07567.1 NADH dehydrogenase subunit C [Desulfitobacterium metallireducens DSM 15288]